MPTSRQPLISPPMTPPGLSPLIGPEHSPSNALLHDIGDAAGGGLTLLFGYRTIEPASREGPHLHGSCILLKLVLSAQRSEGGTCVILIHLWSALCIRETPNLLLQEWNGWSCQRTAMECSRLRQPSPGSEIAVSTHSVKFVNVHRIRRGVDDAHAWKSPTA